MASPKESSEVKELRAIRNQLVSERNELRAKLRELTQRVAHYEQTVRSLHWALNVATAELREHQQKQMWKFDEEKCEWGLAE